MFLCFSTGAWAQHVSKEYQLKAAFLYNFTKFVDWPQERFVTENSPFVIVVLGKNPFEDELAKLVSGRIVNGRPIVVRYIKSMEDLSPAHIVFVVTGSEHLLTQTGSDLSGILTVGESEEFAERGGIIRFTLVAEKVRFEINQSASEKAGLRLSGQLLKLATIVR